MDLFWGLRTERTIAGALNNISESMDAAAAMGRGANVETQRNDDSNERLDQLLLVTAAMWELVKEKTGMTDEDLVNRVAILDAADGVADGKLTYQPTQCPQCKRTVFPKHQRCLYCGAAVAVGNVFRTI